MLESFGLAADGVGPCLGLHFGRVGFRVGGELALCGSSFSLGGAPDFFIAGLEGFLFCLHLGFDCPVEFRFGCGQTAARLEQHTEVVVCVDVPWPQRDRTPETVFGLVQPAFDSEQIAEVVDRIRVIRRVRDGLLAGAILTESALSFLGLGVQPPTPSWGNILTAGKDNIEIAWWLSVFPGLAILFTVMSYNLLGEGIREAIDPRLKE